MANLADYIDFNVTFTKGDFSSSLILSDPNNYPPGVDVGLLGYFTITQPDTITITGSYDSPDISWDGTELTTATKPLRLRADGEYQQGEYTFIYTISAPGYDETELTKTVVIDHISPSLTITENFDVFTPNLSVTDDTDYELDNHDLLTVEWDWEAAIITVEGTLENVTGSNQTFDLAYLGSYYDSEYGVALDVTVTYALQDEDAWVSIQDIILFSQAYYAFIPPTIIELLELLTDYKAQVDAGNCICGTACVNNCTNLKSTYALAVSIYSHIVERGRNNQTEGLSDYVIQLQKLLNNCVTPTYENTNEVIPAYDWGAGGGGTNFEFYKQMIVGSGVNGAPADGATSYTDASLINKSVVVFLDSVLMTLGLSDRVSISYNMATGTITWNAPLAGLQAISIFTYE